MVEDENSGYEEIAHTADWELRVWASDMPGLMKQSVKGMYALAGVRLADGELETRKFTIPLLDRESALLDFLNELLFFCEHERIGFDYFEIDLEEDHYTINASGRPIVEQTKEIKAVTYHNLIVRETENGLEVNIVFDV